ncbi:MAG: DNA-binding NtrC family response regulator [Hyphomicrobiaceae bacterium]|jgi:DNA-binding NtrC family response regulator
MTIAFIVTEDSVRATARVGLVSPEGSEQLADTITHVGHEVVACSSWSELTSRASEGALDLVFCHESCLDAMPIECIAPVLRMQDDGMVDEQALAPLLALAVELASKTARLSELENLVGGIRSGSAMVGNTPTMRRLQAAVSRAADCDATALIEGPIGSGKSLAARAVHLKSRRCAEQLVVTDCGSMTADGLSKAIANGTKTTIVLESVDKLSSAAQAVLVKHLKERSTSRAPQLARLIATTSAHIPELVARGAFREDLYYRLNAFPVMVPGLHERVDDIPALADAILDGGVSASGRSHQGFTPAARLLLESMQWPGNVAQLESTIRRGQMLAGGAAIDREHLMAPVSNGTQNSVPAAVAGNRGAEEGELTENSIRPFEDEEKFLLGRALQATKGNVRRAAQLLGIGRATLYRKIQQYQLRLH